VTQISFYTHAENKLTVARQLIAKAWDQKLNVLVYAPEKTTADEIDRLLWTQPALSFIPHCRDDGRLANVTPVLIGTQMDGLARADVIINLDDEPPSVFSRFDRLLEIVTADEGDLMASRHRYRFYKERGYELVTHDLQNRR
jgi:DNA polymerase III subunit chi